MIWGRGFGAVGHAVGEVCFNTAMTGYQEVMTDPSYRRADRHLHLPAHRQCRRQRRGRRGGQPACARADRARGRDRAVQLPRPPAASTTGCERNGRIGLAGVDTRALTRAIRIEGAPNGVIAHDPAGKFDIAALTEQARAWPGLEGMDLAKDVSTLQTYDWDEGFGSWARATPRSSRAKSRDKMQARRPKPVPRLRSGRTERAVTPAPTSSRSTMASSATSCATSSPPARA